MDININVQYLVFLVLFGFSGSSEPNCHRVRTEYQNRKIGNIDFVPVSPIHGKLNEFIFILKNNDKKVRCERVVYLFGSSKDKHHILLQSNFN